MDKALGDTFLDPDLEDLLVPRLRVPLDILAAGLEPKLIGSLQPGLLLEAVVRGPIVKFDNLKMSALVQLLEGCQAMVRFEANVELNVRRTLLTFLKLAVHVGAMLEPLGQVLLSVNVRVV